MEIQDGTHSERTDRAGRRGAQTLALRGLGKNVDREPYRRGIF